jgi:protein-tyrosine phosphatase
LIDFHSHLVPGVDDGAADLDESFAALAAFASQGVEAAIVTPHLAGTTTEDPVLLEAYLARIDAGWNALYEMAAAELPALRLERGAEVMLNTPTPHLANPLVRLAGTRFVLVEFPHMMVPPNSADAIFALKMSGWTPIVAHPERYRGMSSDLREAADWRRVGAHLQVNDASLLGAYGPVAMERAWALLRRGWADYLSSDYHARGRCPISDARAILAERGGEEQAVLLMDRNPAHLLADGLPEPVPPLSRPRAPLWQRLLHRDH